MRTWLAASALLLGAACGSDGGGDGAPSSGGPDAGDGGVSGSPGLDERPVNATCRAPARPPASSGGAVGFVPAFPNMDFDGKAIGVLRSRRGSSGPLRWFVVERDGKIWTFVDDQASKDGLAADGATAVERAEVFFTLPVGTSGLQGEGGLLGVAFDPDFGLRDDAAFVYAHYTTYPQNNVWRFRVGGGPGAFTIAASDRIFTTPSGGSNHWGGDLKFGPDGYLYVSLGDGGNGYNAADSQKLSWLRGKILRIDPRSVASGYAVPPSNPFVGASRCDDLDQATLAARADACPEVFAYGFRNPWRMSFDRETGQLWVGDVGTQKEEIDLVAIGKNYGWNACDGVIGAGCPPANAASTMIAPVAQYREFSMASASVTGGYVYRGSALGAGLQGAFIFSDVYSGQLFVIDEPYAHVADPFTVSTTYEHPSATDYPNAPKFRVIAGASVPMLVSFAEDENAELLAVTFGDGKGQGVFRVAPPGAAVADTIPRLLSETGCVDPKDPSKPAPGVIPYDLNAPFWSDGAEKSRFFAIPDGKTIAIGPDGRWDLPNESVTMKHFRLGGRLIETRLFVRHVDGGWAGYTYVWNDAQTDAVKANPVGEARAVGAQTWSYPSRARCMTCHTPEAGGTLGIETGQLNRAVVYPETGREANQIDTLAHVGMFTSAPAAAATLLAFVAPFGDAALEERARVYLHANCSSCHRGDKRPAFELGKTLAETGLCDDPALLVPGDPAASRLLTLLESPDLTERMPKNAGNVIDAAGVKLVSDWIRSRKSCP
ncbi:MAG: PQQ-dependent sugar dehydrogenase [Labilithrix sp.]|nr:PQQ-dependent sugar dehydrogenase [Labilithrix sp.]